MRYFLLATIFILSSLFSEAQHEYRYGSEFKIIVNLEGSIYSSYFTEFNQETFMYDTLANIETDTSTSFRLTFDSALREYASSIEANFTSEKIAELSAIFESWLNDSISLIDVDFIATETGQHFFYYNSLVKVIKRIKTQDTCSCDNYLPWIAGKSSFQCEQDIIVSVSDFKNFLDSNSHFIEEYPDLYTYVQEETRSTVTLSEMKVLYNTQYVQESSKAFFICNILDGTDCGCCGNYSGACVYCSAWCLFHDWTCWKSNCRPWYYCLPGCSPNPCY